MRTLVLIPCFNEEGRAGAVIRSIKAVLPEADVVVVNDASSDGTAQEARSAGATVLSHPVNMGYGAALETGYFYAMQQGFDIILQMDGDGQHVAEDLPVLAAPLLTDAADIVIGSRYSPGNNPADTPLLRKIGHRMFSGIISCLTGLRLADPTSGFHGLNRRALLFLSSGVFPCDYPDTDVILMAHRTGLRIQEVPVRMRASAPGKSMHSGLRPLYYGIKMLLSILVVLLNYRVWRKWRNRS